MSASTSSMKIARADVIGSLIRPQYLLDARAALREGRMSQEELRAVEDRAALEAIALQEDAGLDAISDGEYRRFSWIVLVPTLADPSYVAPLSGFEFIEDDSVWTHLWHHADGSLVGRQERPQPFVTRRIEPVRDIAFDEFAFLKEHTTRARPKFLVPSPSWHRIFWHPEHSRDAYTTSDEFIEDMTRYIREHIVERLIELGCEYIHLDAPNYGQFYIEERTRAAFEAAGRDMDRDLAVDAEFDNAVFEGVSGMQRGIHICRGNAPGGRFMASGGYEVIAETVFPRLTNYDTLLLEYDTERAGGFEPLQHVLSQHNVVLGLVTTKRGELEDADALKRRIEEAAAYVPLERLALSSQCGFASASNMEMTREEQQAKLELIGRVAREVWG